MALLFGVSSPPCAAYAGREADNAAGAVSLSSLDLTRATQGWGKPGVDHSVDGHVLTLHGQTYPHGFGTHAPGVLAVRLDGKATRFTATVGVDDESLTSHRGSAEFLVLGDGNRILWRSGVCHPGDVPRQVSVDLRGVRQAILRVTDGGDGFEFDHADWADATFTLAHAGDAITAVPLPVTEPKIALTHLPGDEKKIAALRATARKTLAATPPMGWNSYDAYGDSVTETETLANAAFLRDRMLPYGWDTAVVDYRWYDPGAHDNNANGRAGAPLTMDGFGRLTPSPNRFPSAANDAGFRALASKIHAMGLHFGIHIMRGIPRNAVQANLPIEGSAFHAADAADTHDTCPWCPDMFGVRGDTPAGKAYYASLMRLYASWGVDFIKMDDTSRPYHTHEIEAVHDAIAACGRPIVLSLSPGETPIDDAAHVAAHANQWRVADDFWDAWAALDHEFVYAARWQGVGGPDHWPDADMLPIGRLSVGHRSVGADRTTHFTHAEQVTLLSLWSLLPSPLMVGADLPTSDEWTLALLTNPEVLAVNQDPDGTPAVRAAQNDETEIWVKPLRGGALAVGLFNRGALDANITLAPPMLGTKKAQSRWVVRDLWQRRESGPLGKGYTASVPAHGAVLLKLTPTSTLGR